MPEYLSPQVAWEAIQNGEATLVDLRPVDAFARLHPKGALSLRFSPSGLADRLAVVLPAGASVILLASDEQEAEAALAQLKTSSFSVYGVVEGGLEAWQGAGLPVEPLDEITIRELVSLQSAPDTVVLDVREPMEWEVGHVPGALLISLGSLRRQLDRVPRDAHIAVICESGVRSCVAASILQAEGFTRVANVVEGTRGYRLAGLPLEYWEPVEESG